MSVLMRQKSELISAIETAIQAALDKGDLVVESVPEVGLEVPREKQHGDFASNIALAMAKPAKKAPREVAQIIVKACPQQV